MPDENVKAQTMRQAKIVAAVGIVLAVILIWIGLRVFDSVSEKIPDMTRDTAQKAQSAQQTAARQARETPQHVVPDVGTTVTPPERQAAPQIEQRTQPVQRAVPERAATSRTQPDPSLQDEIMDELRLGRWLSYTVAASLGMNHGNYAEVLENAMQYFTREGWEDFLEFLHSSNLIHHLKAGEGISSILPHSAPRVISKGVFRDNFRWIVETDFTLNVRFADGTSRQWRMPMRVAIDHVPPAVNPQRVAISGWALRPPAVPE